MSLYSLLFAALPRETRLPNELNILQDIYFFTLLIKTVGTVCHYLVLHPCLIFSRKVEANPSGVHNDASPIR